MKKTLEQYKKELDNEQKEIIEISKRNGNRVYLKVKCKECGEEKIKNPQQVKLYGCRKCEGKNITERQRQTLEQIKETKIGKFIYENQMEKMNKLLKEQNVNKATKVMMDLQKPLKKFYEKKSSKITKEMVEDLIRIAKSNENFENNAFVKEYLK